MAKKQVSNNRPVGVSILAILTYIGAVVTLILGVIAIVAAPVLSALFAEMPWLAAAGTAVGIMLGITLIILAVLSYFLGRGLWNGRNWARIIMIVLSVLSIISAIYPLQLFSLIVNGVIVWYLGFSREAKSYFK